MLISCWVVGLCVVCCGCRRELCIYWNDLVSRGYTKTLPYVLTRASTFDTWREYSSTQRTVSLGGAVKRERGKIKLKISPPRLTTFIAWRRPSKGDYCDLLNVMLIHYCIKNIYYMHVNRVWFNVLFVVSWVELILTFIPCLPTFKICLVWHDRSSSLACVSSRFTYLYSAGWRRARRWVSGKVL